MCQGCYVMCWSVYCRCCQLEPFCEHEPCAGVVWASLETRLGSFTQLWVVRTTIVFLWCYIVVTLADTFTVGCLTCHQNLAKICTHHDRTSYDCILGSSPSLIEVWWNEFCRVICFYIYNPGNNCAWHDAFTSIFKARTIPGEKGAHENM